jgi:hypothetical protein
VTLQIGVSALHAGQPTDPSTERLKPLEVEAMILTPSRFCQQPHDVLSSAPERRHDNLLSGRIRRSLGAR